MRLLTKIHPQPARLPVATRRELSRQQGQITVEYFLLAALIASVTLFGIGTFPTLLRKTLEAFVDAAAKRFAGS